MTSLSFAKGCLKLGANQLLTQACSFVRNVILARFISPGNFGIAATLAMTFSLFEMVSNISVEQLLVQAEDGNECRFQNTAQLLRAGRGLMNASLILLLARPVSRVFGVPDAQWAFRYLALVPFLKGLAHLDLNRLQRDMEFGPAVINNIVSSVLVTLAAWPLAAKFHDYSAMLYLLIAQTAFSTIGSHLVAKRHYGWAWDFSYAKRMSSFGWPLLVNGLLMFIIFDGDRFVIGTAHRLFPRSSYSLADLGIYSVAFALTMAPSSLVANVCSSLFLPLLSRAQNLRSQFERRYTVCAQAVAFAAVLMAVPFIIAGGWVVALVYGQKYAAAGSFIGLLGTMWGLRTFRVAPTAAAIALGDTKNSMVSNIARTVALPGILIVSWAGYGLPWIAACGVGGELLALAVCIWRLEREHAVPASICLKPFAVSAFGIIVAAMLGFAGIQHVDWTAAFLVSPAVVGMVGITMLVLFPGLRADLLALVCGSRASRTNEKAKRQAQVGAVL